jgi:peptidoglycan-associated lipoprotein
MKTMRSAMTILGVLVLALALATGCGSKKAVEKGPEPDVSTTPPPPKPVESNPVPEKPPVDLAYQLVDIHFDFDRADLRGSDRDILTRHGDWLSDNPSVRLSIEGHCDERGTVEYNLALGERRARTAKDFLVSYGVDAGRLETISYGKERPEDPGHDESAWAKNRRAEFVKR